MEKGLPHHFEPGYMERWTHSHGSGELESVGDRVNPPQDFEWSHETRDKLMGVHSQGEIQGEQPYSLARPEEPEGLLVVVGVPLLSSGRMEQGGTCSGPGEPASENECLHQGKSSINLLL